MRRVCGECTVCCIIPSIPELEKPKYTPCKNLCATGCGIYPDRPPACSEFECAWLMDEAAGAIDLRYLERPDKVGLLFRLAVSEKLGLIVTAYELEKGASGQYWGDKIIHRLKKKHLVIVVYKDDARRIFGPPQRLREAYTYREYLHKFRP
jgi:hypothetical protein